MKKILVATSGYYYKEWKGVFYPEKLKDKDFLTFYSSIFPFTELNFSYYRQPGRKQMENFLSLTGNEFLFTVKAHRSLTHDISENWKTEAQTFLKGVAPLSENGRLGMLLLQFPYSFKYNRKNRLYLGALCETLGEDTFPLGLEFRSDEWNKKRVLEELTRRSAVWINSDNPAIPGLPSGEWKLTGDTGYLRFHGRNRDNWWQGTNVSRYDYRYSEKELEEAAEAIELLAKKVKRLYIAFNNHHKGQAVDNALALEKLLT